jgi:hypothetical protein
MSGFRGYIWAGSLNGNVYVFRMDNYELHKKFTEAHDRVCCLCSILDKYVVSGSAQNDRSIGIWKNVERSNSETAMSPLATTPIAKESTFNLYET